MPAFSYSQRLLLLLTGLAASGAVALAQSLVSGAPPVLTPLQGERFDRQNFPNPNAHIPAQCYTETSFGTQNACQFCHTNGVARMHLGNNNAQAGDDEAVGNLQAKYEFSSAPLTSSASSGGAALPAPLDRNASINPWRNILYPGELRRAAEAQGTRPGSWDMQAYIRQDNWQAAYNQRPRTAKGNGWDTGQSGPFRLFPALSPADLPAQGDGYVRSALQSHGMFRDARGWLTGWRAVNFMPYGIFTPQTGSVSGIYIRLPQLFMKNAAGEFDLNIYSRNLDLVRDNVQGRLTGQKTYLGAASGLGIERGQYPTGTELAHPLHYVDLQADGHDRAISPFPGTRARRVKEIRWMYKASSWDADAYGKPVPPREITDDSEGDESGESENAGVLASKKEAWINNGAGWLLGGWTEDKSGSLRAQTPSELTQCVACHSGNSVTGGTFTSGTGNTVDSTWAMPRQFAGAAGWHEMDYLGYKAPSAGAAFGTLSTPEPVNRGKNVGEYRYFLDHVVGVSLYGNMPESVDAFLNAQITKNNGYSADWPALQSEVEGKNPAGVKAAQEQRQKLMREFTAKGAYLNAAGAVRSELFLPTGQDALETARRYREVVVTQRYDFGKDVFAQTPFTYHYFRTPQTGFTHQNGQPYRPGDLITDRPVNTDPKSPDYGVGTTSTLTRETGNFVGDYVPLLK